MLSDVGEVDALVEALEESLTVVAVGVLLRYEGVTVVLLVDADDRERSVRLLLSLSSGIALVVPVFYASR